MIKGKPLWPWEDEGWRNITEEGATGKTDNPAPVSWEELYQEFKKRLLRETTMEERKNYKKYYELPESEKKSKNE